ncbi:MAG: hypothetical protein MK212_06325 [Saprospiraceae bacterium]|nr:hypothetical protein [Saprospiraceae bacterium]
MRLTFCICIVLMTRIACAQVIDPPVLVDSLLFNSTIKELWKIDDFDEKLKIRLFDFGSLLTQEKIQLTDYKTYDIWIIPDPSGSALLKLNTGAYRAAIISSLQKSKDRYYLKLIMYSYGKFPVSVVGLTIILEKVGDTHKVVEIKCCADIQW